MRGSFYYYFISIGDYFFSTQLHSSRLKGMFFYNFPLDLFCHLSLSLGLLIYSCGNFH